MIQIKQKIVDQIIIHAQKANPIEACGYLAGNGDTIAQSYELRNIDNSEEHFSFDPAEQFTVVRKVREAGIGILANYHSHPKSPARPSEEDIRMAYDPDILYLIISLAYKTPQIKAYKIRQSKVEEETIQIIN
ncbi:MAG: M67 family metallopeptidase [Candidatus Shapirobacteria bacterium]